MVDWNKALETVEGVPVRLRWPMDQQAGSFVEVYIDGMRESRTYARDGKHYAGEHPDIRNVIPKPSPDLQARCVAVVDLVARRMNDSDTVTEARAIMSEMRPDPDVLTARDIVFADHVANGFINWDRSELDAGKLDSERPMRLALAALRKGRALEREET